MISVVARLDCLSYVIILFPLHRSILFFFFLPYEFDDIRTLHVVPLLLKSAKNSLYLVTLKLECDIILPCLPSALDCLIKSCVLQPPDLELM